MKSCYGQRGTLRHLLVITAKKFLLMACTVGVVPFATASAQQAGVLLGLQPAVDSGDVFRSYWITRDKGVIQLVAAGPDLIVPRASGFWRVCIVSRTSLDDAQLCRQQGCKR